MDISVTNLPAGDYLFRSYHLDSFTGSALGFAQGSSPTSPNTIEAHLSGSIRDSVQPTALGAAGLNTTFLEDSAIPTIGFPFSHDGTSTLVISLSSTQANGTNRFLLLNGFELFRANP